MAEPHVATALVAKRAELSGELGKLDECRAAIKAHIAHLLAPRDPRTKFFNVVLALAYLTTGQADRALEWARAAAHPQSDFVEAPLTQASILAHLGKEKEARAALDRIAVANLGAVERRPYWRRYKYPKTKELVLDGLRKAGLPE